MNNITTKKVTVAGLMAALCFAGYAVFPAISVTGTKIHLGNAFVVLAALLLGGSYGGLAGAIGLCLADILTGYAASAPRTFISKLLIGIVVGLIAHKAGKIKECKDKKRILLKASLAAIGGLAFNCVFEPALKYVWYTLLTPNADKAASAIKSLLAITAWTTVVNSVINAIAAILLFEALLPFIRRMGMWDKDVKKN